MEQEEALGSSRLSKESRLGELDSMNLDSYYSFAC